MRLLVRCVSEDRENSRDNEIEMHVLEKNYKAQFISARAYVYMTAVSVQYYTKVVHKLCNYNSLTVSRRREMEIN